MRLRASYSRACAVLNAGARFLSAPVRVLGRGCAGAGVCRRSSRRLAGWLAVGASVLGGRCVAVWCGGGRCGGSYLFSYGWSLWCAVVPLGHTSFPLCVLAAYLFFILWRLGGVACLFSFASLSLPLGTSLYFFVWFCGSSLSLAFL